MSRLSILGRLYKW